MYLFVQRVLPSLLWIGIFPAVLHAQGWQLSGGLDARYTQESHPRDDELKLEGAFLNLRKVWSDDLGDRWWLVAQADFDDNLEEIRPYQAYLQYKGPLGKWNVRAGHFLLPFGLLATYDTERLVLQGLERINLGIRKDTGLEILGHFGPWDYAFSVTDGLGDVHFSDPRASPLLTARLAYVQEDWQVGLSALVGRLLLDPELEVGRGVVRERRIALDATNTRGPLMLRAEAIGGADNGRAVRGGLLLADYAVTSKLELNTRYAYWHREGDRHFADAGLTYQIRPGWYVRLAYDGEWGKEKRDAFTAQLYFELSKLF